MGTEILHPQDCFIERLRIAPELRPRFRSYHTKSNRRATVRPETKKRGSDTDPAVSRKSGSVKDNKLVMGQVAILRRGESLDLIGRNEASAKKAARQLAGSEPFLPEPAKVPKQIRIADRRSGESDDVYAGSAFFLSPSPRALPLPSFSKKKKQSVAAAAAPRPSIDDSATKDLRRLLRLD